MREVVALVTTPVNESDSDGDLVTDEWMSSMTNIESNGITLQKKFDEMTAILLALCTRIRKL